MRVAEDRLKRICLERGITISELLVRSGVSRNAFYTLARKKNILPGSILAMAQTLGISVFELVEVEPSPVERARKLHSEVGRITRGRQDVDAENVRHTLQLLNEKPVDRLRRALTRAQRFNFQ